MSSTDPKMFQLVNKNTSQSCRFWIDSLILICHDEAVLLEEKLKQAKCNSLLSKFQFWWNDSIHHVGSYVMLFFEYHLPRADTQIKRSNEIKSHQMILWDHSLRSFIWIYMITFDPSVVVVVFAYFQGLIICSFKAWTLRWWPSPVL